VTSYRATKVLLLAVLAISCQSPGIAGVCSADALSMALASAAPGDHVSIGACTIRGNFAVPAGVTLVGGGPTSIVASGGAMAPVLDVTTGSSTTTIASLTIESSMGQLGIRASGGGMLAVHDVVVSVTRGLGIGARDGALTISHSQLTGPLDATNAASAPTDPSQTGTWGLVGSGATLSLDDVRFSGFAVGAIAVEGGSLDWTDDDTLADLDASRGVGIALFGAHATLTGVELGGMLSGIAMPGVAVVAIPGAGGARTALALTDTTIAHGAGYGVFASNTDVTLTHASVTGVGLVGLQLQGCTLVATQLTLHANGGAGLALLDSGTVQIDGGTISAQSTVALPIDAGTSRVADGIAIRRTSTSTGAIDVALSNVHLDDNPRVGLLIDAAGTAPMRLTLTNVETSATDAGALGVVAQRTMLPAGWDSGVRRTGMTVANDAAFSGMIDVISLVMPPALVAPTL